jgi:hypothetical protein
VYALLDNSNKAHVVIDTTLDVVNCVLGKQNKVPNKKYFKYILEFLTELGKNSNDDFFIKNYATNKFSTIFDIPNNAIVKNIDLSSKKFKDEKIVLPNNLTIKNALTLSEYSNIEELPMGLIVSTLLASYCPFLKQLPDDIIIKKHAELQKHVVIPPNIMEKFHDRIKVY